MERLPCNAQLRGHSSPTLIHCVPLHIHPNNFPPDVHGMTLGNSTREAVKAAFRNLVMCYLGPLVSSGTEKDLCQPWVYEGSYFHPCLCSPPQPPTPAAGSCYQRSSSPPTPPTGNVLYLKQNGGFRGVLFIMLYNLCTRYIYSF